MTTLHMETDAVRAMANQLKQAAEVVRSQSQTVNSSAQNVDWMGQSRDQFVNEVAGLAREMDGKAEAGTILAERVEAEIVEWEQMAASFGSGNGSDAFVGNGFSGGGFGGGSGGLDPARAGIVGSIGLFTWEQSHKDPFPTSDKFMLDGVEIQGYKGSLKGDLSLKDVTDFIEKDPFEKKIDKSIGFYKATDTVGGAIVDAKVETPAGNFETQVGAVEADFSRSIEYKDGALQANAEVGAGIYAVKDSYNANLAGATVAATGYLGAEASAKGTAYFDPKKGEIGAKGDVEAFAGEKIEGSVSKEIVGGVTGTASGSLSYGVGVTAKGDVGFSQGHVRAEFELGATLGLGADLGFSVDLDVGKAANTVSDLGKSAADWLFGGW